MAKIYHSEIFGLREKKYSWLEKHDISNTKWKKIFPRPEFYLFTPTDNKLANHYYSFYKITEIFPVNCVGVVTARDNFVTDFEKNKLEQRINQFVDRKFNEEILKQTYGLTENKSWKIGEQREKLRKDFDWKDSITKILYRPFDERWILYHDEMIERSRKDIMQNLLEENIALCIGRQSSVIGSDNYDIVFVSEQIVDFNLFRRGGELVFPLYIYRKKTKKKKPAISQLLMFEPEAEYEAILPNISFDVRNLLSESFNKPFLNPLDYDKRMKGFGSKEIFYYTYAILYSTIYCAKYAEFLKMDFPHIPFTKDYKLFIKFSKLGKQLADLHLLKSKKLDKPISKFSGKGDNKVQKPIFKHKKIWLNDKQFFDGVKEEVWNYKIGGYQVCEKWLKDRKKRTLTLNEITTYCKIVTALSTTIQLQKQIDEIYKGVEE